MFRWIGGAIRDRSEPRFWRSRTIITHFVPALSGGLMVYREIVSVCEINIVVGIVIAFYVISF
jgi:hypothetical protein